VNSTAARMNGELQALVGVLNTAALTLDRHATPFPRL
jgi:hypothetical protein